MTYIFKISVFYVMVCAQRMSVMANVKLFLEHCALCSVVRVSLTITADVK